MYYKNNETLLMRDENSLNVIQFKGATKNLL